MASWTDALSGLFQGTPQAAPSYSATTSDVPKWLQDYTVDLFSQQRAVSSLPYQSYQLPRVASESKDTSDAYALTRGAVGDWQNSTNAAAQGTANIANSNQAAGGMNMLNAAATGYNPMASASPYFNQAGAMQTAAGNTGTAGDLYANQNQYLNPQGAQFNLAKGVDTLGNAAGMNATGAASPYLNQAANVNITGAASPYLNQAANISGLGAASPYINQAASMNNVAAASPYLNAAAGMSGAAAANPYLNASAQSSAANVGNYMNPYNEAVTDQIAKLGARNLTENLLPGVSDQFIRAGSFGGSRMGEFGNRALRDTQESILGQQSQALQQGYGQALTASQSDLARMGQLGATAGNLTQGQQQALSQIGGQYGNLSQGQQAAMAQLGATTGSLAGQQQSALANIGSQYGNLAQAQQQGLANIGQQYGSLTQAQQNALANIGQQYTAAGQAQQGYGLNAAQAGQQAQQADLARQISAGTQLANIGQNVGALSSQQQQNLANIGQNIGTLGLQQGTQQLGALAQAADIAKMQQGLATSDAAALQSIGGAQQAQQQAGLDIAYQNFMNQQNWPQQQINNMSTTLRGLNPAAIPTTQTTAGSTTQFSPSPLSQIASGYFAGKGLGVV
jgi:hypothetical protein